jgi:hypothetical protein
MHDDDDDDDDDISAFAVDSCFRRRLLLILGYLDSNTAMAANPPEPNAE